MIHMREARGTVMTVDQGRNSQSLGYSQLTRKDSRVEQATISELRRGRSQFAQDSIHEDVDRTPQEFDGIQLQELHR